MLGPACVGEKAAGSGHSTPRAENMGATAADEDDDDVVGGGDVVVELGIIVHSGSFISSHLPVEMD